MLAHSPLFSLSHSHSHTASKSPAQALVKLEAGCVNVLRVFQWILFVSLKLIPRNLELHLSWSSLLLNMPLCYLTRLRAHFILKQGGPLVNKFSLGKLAEMLKGLMCSKLDGPAGHFRFCRSETLDKVNWYFHPVVALTTGSEASSSPQAFLDYIYIYLFKILFPLLPNLAIRD